MSAPMPGNRVRIQEGPEGVYIPEELIGAEGKCLEVREFTNEDRTYWVEVDGVGRRCFYVGELEVLG